MLSSDPAQAIDLERRETELKEKALRNKVVRSRKASIADGAA